MKNELLKNVLKTITIIWACLLIGAGCMTMKKCFVWAYETINDMEQITTDVPDEQTTPTPAPTTIPPANTTNDACIYSNIKWLKANGSKAVITRKLHSATILGGGSKVSIKYDKLGWEDVNGCNAILCFFVIRNGNICGGKFDHLRSGGQSLKLMENIHGGYIPNILPIVKGEEAYFCIVDYKSKERTNVVKAEWK